MNVLTYKKHGWRSVEATSPEVVQWGPERATSGKMNLYGEYTIQYTSIKSLRQKKRLVIQPSC